MQKIDDAQDVYANIDRRTAQPTGADMPITFGEQLLRRQEPPAATSQSLVAGQVPQLSGPSPLHQSVTVNL